MFQTMFMQITFVSSVETSPTANRVTVRCPVIPLSSLQSAHMITVFAQSYNNYFTKIITILNELKNDEKALFKRNYGRAYGPID